MTPELLKVISRLTIPEFTINDLTSAYYSDFESRHRNKKAARQFVYRDMVRMMENGDLERVTVKDGWPLYVLTSQFWEKLPSSAPAITRRQLPIVEAAIASSDIRQNLLDRLSLAQVELLTANGEIEEYDAICLAYPEMRPGIQVVYNKVRSSCSKVVGRVKALECMLVNLNAK